ncbi:MAG TPA: penicillin-binding protein [Candidatus Scybalousia intestinigallinarum]|nr:penicillin-binding protein [Candidatus Scybalousia intestinigallinarum]
MKKLKKIIKIFVLLMIIVLLAFGGVILYIKMSPKLEIKNANAFLMYDSQNELFFQGSGSQEWVNLEDISDKLITATIYTEDKHFYQHFGFDFLRIAKAMFVNITSGSKSQGASTISQQYAKNLFLDFDKTWERKLKEMWITLQLEVHYDKDEILEGYLNTINYGHGMYGIQNAAKFYFDKNASELDWAEAAMLTGIPKSPSNYSPIVNFELAKQRQTNILYNLYQNDVISEEEYNQAVNEELTIVGEKNSQELANIMYYQDAVMRELNSLEEIPDSLLETGGIKIYTNLDMNAQSILENSIKNNLTEDTELQVASVMMDPNTGKIIALVGGKDYNKSQYNRAYQSARQVGSTMKPFLYYAALESGFTSSTTFTSEQTTFTFSNNQTYSPQNYGDQYGNKPISLATAISYSDNIYAVKTHMFLGEDALVNISKRLGITAELEEVPSLPLGTASINIIEMAAAYSAFANEGYKVEGYLISRVEDLKGNVLYEHKEEKENILNKSLTYILSELLTSTYDSTFIDYNYPTAIGIAPKIKHKLALKSGTTNTDHWSIGYNHNIVTAVWIGYDDNRDIEASDYKYSRNIWVEATEGYLQDQEDAWYKQPSNVVGVLVNPITGKPATEADEKKKIMYYVKGTEPSSTDTVFDELLEQDEQILEQN